MWVTLENIKVIADMFEVLGTSSVNYGYIM
jgi:hypothetical protein